MTVSILSGLESSRRESRLSRPDCVVMVSDWGGEGGRERGREGRREREGGREGEREGGSERGREREREGERGGKIEKIGSTYMYMPLGLDVKVVCC